MEESRALSKLLDAADLISMLEDLTQPGTMARITEGSLAGLRLTLKNIRENILSGHHVLSAQFLDQNAERMAPAVAAEPAAVTNKPAMNRRDLRASLEKLVERSV